MKKVKSLLLSFVVIFLFNSCDCGKETPTEIKLTVKIHDKMEHGATDCPDSRVAWVWVTMVRFIDDVLYYPEQIPADSSGETPEFVWDNIMIHDLTYRCLITNPLKLYVRPGPDLQEYLDNDILFSAKGLTRVDNVRSVKYRGVIRARFKKKETVEVTLIMRESTAVDEDYDYFSPHEYYNDDGYNYRDCNDRDEYIRPFGPEVCDDSIDNNCNGTTDEGC